MSPYRLYSYRFLSITLFIILVIIQITSVFGNDDDGVRDDALVHCTRIVPHFWVDENPYYEYIKNQNSFSEELKRMLENTATIPENIKERLELPLYNYLYVTKNPSLKEAGEALIELVDKDGIHQKVKITLKRLTQKMMPTFSSNIKIHHIRDVVQDDRIFASILVSAEMRVEQEFEILNHRNILETVFFMPEEIQEFVLNTTIQNRKKSPKSERRSYASYYTSVRQEYPVRKTESDSVMITPLHVHATVEARTGDGFSETIAEGEDIPEIDSTPFFHKPPWILFEFNKEMLETEPFLCKDRTDCKNKKVFVDYKELRAEEQNDFLNGRYRFRPQGRDTVHTFTIVYTYDNGNRYKYTDYVICYTMKPISFMTLSGHPKTNRTVTAHLHHMQSHYAKRKSEVVSEIKLTFTPAGTPFAPQSDEMHEFVKILHASDNILEFVPKAEGSFTIRGSCAAKALHSEHSDESSMESECIAENLFVHGDLPPQLYLQTNRNKYTRNDTVDVLHGAASSDGDGIKKTELKLFRVHHRTEMTEMPVSKQMKLPLGEYALFLKAEEDTGITADAEARFSVENAAPTCKLVFTKTEQLPKVDVVIVTDQENHAKMISEHLPRIEKNFIEKGIDISFNHWDKTIYRYAKSINTSVNSGERYPSDTCHYHQDGFHGILRLTGVSNNSRTFDRGFMTSIEKSHEISEDAINTSSPDMIYEWRKGSWRIIRNWSGSLLPNHKYISCPHGHGSVRARKLPGVYGGVPIPPTHVGYEGERYYAPFIFYTSYSGTCRYQAKVWKSRYVTEDDYTGYYQGNVNKEVQSAYIPKYRHPSDKLTCYYQVGQESEVISESSDHPSVFYHGDIQDFEQFLLKHIESLIPPQHTVLVDESFSIEALDHDMEDDEVRQSEIEIIHDSASFDDVHENRSAKTDRLPSVFEIAGLYRITRTIEDVPPVPGYEKSSAASISITAHRKPVAQFEVDWNYLNQGYEILISDNSYDPDQKSRPDKGISHRVFRYRKGEGDWIYRLPARLDPGKYTLSLSVRDSLGAWSDEAVRELELFKLPVIVLHASLKHDFSGQDKIPAGENLTVCDIKSKYHADHMTHRYEFDTAVHTRNQHYQWNDCKIKLPEDLPDGRYFITIHGISSISKEHDNSLSLPLTIETPIELDPEIRFEDNPVLLCKTNKYVRNVAATVFKGTPFERVIPLHYVSGTEKKLWSAELNCDNQDIPDGIYTTTFTASTLSGKHRSVDLTEEFHFLNIKDILLSGEWNNWNTNRFMGYEKIRIRIILNNPADRVEIRFSPQLEAMKYVSSTGDSHYYHDELGYTVEFPMQAKNMGNFKVWEASYILPIAKSTVNRDDIRLENPYQVEISAFKGNRTVSGYQEIDITGNIHDMIYIRPLGD
ncbi:MAG: hypothetical protein Q4A41_00075 [Bacillota bacterium]|nr:hypothetical protein [Bacillota bacterium]